MFPQVEVSAQMRDDSEKCENFFLQYFLRCERVVSNISNVFNSIGLLSQAADAALLGWYNFISPLYMVMKSAFCLKVAVKSKISFSQLFTPKKVSRTKIKIMLVIY